MSGIEWRRTADRIIHGKSITELTLVHCNRQPTTTASISIIIMTPFMAIIILTVVTVTTAEGVKIHRNGDDIAGTQLTGSSEQPIVVDGEKG